MVANLAWVGVSVHCIVLSYVSVFSLVPLQLLDYRFTQSTHQFKQCYFQLVSNPQCSEIRPPKYLNYRCMSLHLEINFVRFIPHSFFQLHIEFWKYFQFDFMQCRQRLLWKSRVLYFLADCFSVFQHCKGILYW